MNHGKTDRIWTISPASKIEGEAIRQLERAGSLPGMLRAVGLPDLYPGKGAPVGAAFFTDGMVYPYLLGNDIGCCVAPNFLLKELRVQHKGRPFRVFFAFDPLRQAVMLCGGDKTGDKHFYETMISIAEREFLNYLQEEE